MRSGTARPSSPPTPPSPDRAGSNQRQAGRGGGKDKFADHSTASDAEAMSGFLLRSDVVANWPGVLVDAFDAAGRPLDRVRLDRLSANVLIGVFRGEIGRVSFPPCVRGSLHFGVDRPDLQLVTWGAGPGVLTSGKSLVIAGIDGDGLLHIRAFDAAGVRTDIFERKDRGGSLHLVTADASGKVLSDKLESDLFKLRNDAIKYLKQNVPGLSPPHDLSSAEKGRVLSEVTSIVGHHKALRDAADDRSATRGVVAITLQPPDAAGLGGRVIDIAALATAMAEALNVTAAEFTSAHLAFQMIEGAPQVDFRRSAPAAPTPA